MKKRKNATLKMAAAVMSASLVAGSMVPALPTMAAGKTKTMYVVTDIVSNDGTEAYHFTYNKKGLVKNETFSGSKTTYKYKNRALREIITKSEHFSTSKTKYTYNKKALISKLVTKEKDGKDVLKYYYDKKDRVKKIVETDTNKEGKTVRTYSYKYNKKNQVKKMTGKVEIGSKVYKSSYKYKYNKRGEIVKVTTSDNFTVNYKYTHKGKKSNKRRTKVTVSYESPISEYNTSSSYKYTYKKIKVPADRVAQVKAQQKQQLNTTGFGYLVVAFQEL